MQAICNLMMPNLMSDIVNVGIQDYAMQIASADGVQAEVLKDQQMKYILTVGVKMLLVALLTVAVDLGIHLVNSFSGTGISRDLRRAVFSKIESFSSQEYSEFSTASLITRTTNDVQQVQMLFTMGLRMIFYAPIMGIGAVFMAVEKAPSMAWINVLTVVCVTVLMTINFLFMSSKFKVLQSIVDRLNLTARESLTGILVVRAFSKQKYEEDKFDSVNREYADTNLFINRVMSLIMPTLTLLQNLIPVLIIVVCADKIAQSTMQVGDMMAFIQYSATIMSSFMMISMIFIMLPRAKVSITRISEVLSKENTIVETDNPVNADFERCTVEFDNVSFKYPDGDEYAVENVSFVSNPGEVTAIIGSTGCGKSSLIQLIPRLYEVTDGAVKINGTDIRNFGLTALRDLISYVPQKSQLFSGTIKSNLEAGREGATQQDIEKAAK
ncbi:MAG: ABC transporter ATP-binding protein, partial [Oscillospiraceae bacterium]|nr:ABC transporter ATP-binding protein [Oscillospiraceae bacterium]